MRLNENTTNTHRGNEVSKESNNGGAKQKYPFSGDAAVPDRCWRQGKTADVLNDLLLVEAVFAQFRLVVMRALAL